MKTSRLLNDWRAAILLSSLLFTLTGFMYIYWYVGYQSVVQNQLPDASDYCLIAIAVAAEQQFGAPVFRDTTTAASPLFGSIDERLNNVQNVERYGWRPPLWPLMMAIVFVLFGGSFSLLLMLKYAIAVSIIVLSTKLLHDSGIRGATLVAASAFLAVAPSLLIYSVQMLTETLTMLLIVLHIIAIYRIATSGRSRSWLYAIAGASGAGIVLSHPYYLFLPLATLVYMLIIRIKVVHLASAALCFALPVSLWLAFNAYRYDGRLLLTTSTGAVVAKGWNSQVLCRFTNTQGDLADEGQDVSKYYSSVNAAELDEVSRSDLYLKTASKFIADNWRLVPAIVMRKLTSGFNPIPETNRGGILETGRMLYFIAFFVPLFGFRYLRRQDRHFAHLYACVVLSYLLMGAITYTGFRFRAPMLAIEVCATIVTLKSIITYIEVRIRERNP